MGFKDLFKVRIPIYIMSGGQMFTKGNGGVASVNIMKGKEPGEIIAKPPMQQERVLRFTNIEWQKDHERSVGKAAAGAIIGSVAGPVGTIAGAAIGGKKKDTSMAYMYVVDEEGNEHRFHIKCDQQTYIQLSSLVG